ncbi:hypothetical protein diail_1018 [Diaporthe ilicicola]|nr:hypothetical protein diail_1018 [Diaporthe ilicicola]
MHYYHHRCPCCLLTVLTKFVDDGSQLTDVVDLSGDALAYYNCPVRLCGYHVNTNHNINLYATWAGGQAISMAPGIVLAPRTSQTMPFRPRNQAVHRGYPATNPQGERLRRTSLEISADGRAYAANVGRDPSLPSSSPVSSTGPANPAVSVQSNQPRSSSHGLRRADNTDRGLATPPPRRANADNASGSAYAAHVGGLPAPAPGVARPAIMDRGGQHGSPPVPMPEAQVSNKVQASRDGDEDAVEDDVEDDEDYEDDEDDEEYDEQAPVTPSGKSRKRWTAEDVDKLLRMANEGRSYDEMVEELGRSKYSLTKKLSAMRSKGNESCPKSVKKRSSKS